MRRPGLILDCLPALCALFLFTGFCGLTKRPWVSLLLCLIILIMFSLINKMKKDLFHEPLTFMDIFLVPQIFRHPGFYIPYLLPPWIMFPTCLSLAGLALIFIAEKPEQNWWIYLLFILSLCLVLRIAWLYTDKQKNKALKLLQKYPLTLKPEQDMHSYGLLGCIFLQSLWHRHKRHEPAAQSIPKEHEYAPEFLPWSKTSLDSMDKDKAPHIILIQAESFFDLRTLDPEIDPDMLPNFDALSRHSISGQLGVYSSGAYTMRTEFSALTGMPLDLLGTDGLDPYQEASKRQVWSLARHLNSLGYDSVFVHPFDTSFFKRYQVMPNLGFKKVIDQSAFRAQDKFGPYISDLALGRWIVNYTSQSESPTFIFAVSIEAHGPWGTKRLKTLPEGPRPALPSWAENDLQVYVRHLKNTDKMLGNIVSELEKLDRQVILCLYGDHPGSLPGVYSRTGYPGNHTHFMLWPGHAENTGKNINLMPEDLGGLILNLANKK